jgi:hypothetical protein
MSRPASLRYQSSPFRKPNKKGPAGTKVGIDFKLIDAEAPEPFEIEVLLRQFRNEKIALQLELQEAQAMGRWSRVRKLRREVNKNIEIQIWLERQWCTSCGNSQHNCHCDDPDWVAPVREQIVIPVQRVVEEVKVRVISSSGHTILKSRREN